MAAKATGSDGRSQTMESEKDQRLKYLEFVQVAALHVFVLVVKLYGYAKDSSGPLKPRIQTVEGTVKSVVSPVYNKFRHVPIEFLKFVDRKVDESVKKVPVPPLLKQVASDVKTVGVLETASGLVKTVYIKYKPAAMEVYSKYEPVAEQHALRAWLSLNKLPFFTQVAQKVVPAAAFCSEKYNKAVQKTANKGYKVALYLPLVPTDKIAKIFRGLYRVEHAETEIVIEHSQDKVPAN